MKHSPRHEHQGVVLGVVLGQLGRDSVRVPGLGVLGLHQELHGRAEHAGHMTGLHPHGGGGNVLAVPQPGLHLRPLH